MTGTISNIVAAKGFGFVRGEDGVEYFFHRSACRGIRNGIDGLQVGDKVRFEDGESAKGPRAEKLGRI